MCRPALVALWGWRWRSGGWYSASHFAINTEYGPVDFPDIGWRRDEIAYQKAFPQFNDLIVAVIDGPTARASDAAADRLTGPPEGRRGKAVVRAWRPDSNAYLDREGLLLLDKRDLELTLAEIDGRRDFFAALAADPSLRGLATPISGAMQNAEKNRAAFSQFVEPSGQARRFDRRVAGGPCAGAVVAQPVREGPRPRRICVALFSSNRCSTSLRSNRAAGDCPRARPRRRRGLPKKPGSISG